MNTFNHIPHVKEITSGNLEDIKHTLASKEINLIWHEEESPVWHMFLCDSVQKFKEQYQFWSIKKSSEEVKKELEMSLRNNSLVPESIHVDFIKLLMSHYHYFIQLTEDNDLFFSLRTIDEGYFTEDSPSVSKEWHLDTATLTLATTFCGLGTQWTPNSNIKREYFNHKKIVPETSDGPLKDRTLYFTLPRYGFSILKGELREGEDETSREFLSHFLDEENHKSFNEGGGLVHRGPFYENEKQKRFLLTISSFKIPSFLE